MNTIMDYIKPLLKLIKTPAKCFIPLFFTLSVIIFAPDTYVENFGIVDWGRNYNSYLGITFIFSFFVVFCHYTPIILKWVTNIISAYTTTRRRINKIKTLTFQEKKILAGYFKTETKTISLPQYSGVVAGLENSRVIYSSSTKVIDDEIEFSINDWAWDYINNDIRRLEPFTNEIIKLQQIRKKLIPVKYGMTNDRSDSS